MPREKNQNISFCPKAAVLKHSFGKFYGCTKTQIWFWVLKSQYVLKERLYSKPNREAHQKTLAGKNHNPDLEKTSAEILIWLLHASRHILFWHQRGGTRPVERGLPPQQESSNGPEQYK